MAFDFPKSEEKILKFWEENKIFKKLRKKNRGKKRWSFLDGPITANNPMGVHHAWGRTYKDLFQRYKAMQGFDQRFQNGFDCQGLWVEVEVEKELGFKTKKDIEKYGIEKFVEACKRRVKKYAKIQTDQSIRLGQWMDWENSYYTMSDENNYSIWGFLKKCHKQGYLYKGRDAVPWCPRCGTAISQHEILTEEYKEITHESVYFQLPIVGRENEYLLVWTTTPWTLPANIAVAVDKKIDYALVQEDLGRKFWMAKELVEKIFKDEEHKILETLKGKKLVGLRYSWAFDNFPRIKEVADKNKETFHKVVATDSLILPVTTEEGTGLVHIAVSAGQEDFRLGKKLGLPLIEIIDEDATYLDGLGKFSGDNAKQRPQIILDYLEEETFNNLPKWVFKVESYPHRYPTCWRCKTELVWRVVDEWYINMGGLREKLVKIVKKIKWIPEFGLERELDWLKNMGDWLISKKRYWGLALPIFECQNCGNFEVVGSKEELKKRVVEGWSEFEGHSPHRPWVDKVKIKCDKCGELVSRIKDVGNPWLDAGIVPFSTMEYFENKNYWRKWFPADFICESFPGQFKNWFYSLLVMAVGLENKEPSKTIFGYASVRDEKGEEMHKSKGNAIWFDDAVNKIGADPMRWLYASQNPALNLNFGYTPAEEVKKKLLVLYNSYVFLTTYVDKKLFPKDKIPVLKNSLDKWIVSRLSALILAVTNSLDKYYAAAATDLMEKFFIDDLSLWYIRRSRKRFHEGYLERKAAIRTLYYVLLNFAKIAAPVIPFFAEEVYGFLYKKGMPESIHLQDWPKADKKALNRNLEEKMSEVRKIVTRALAKRAEAGIKIRQPLSELRIKSEILKVNKDKKLLELIRDEVNVKDVIFGKTFGLNTKITKELKEEGAIRDFVRGIQGMRKEAGLTPKDKIVILVLGLGQNMKIVENNKKNILTETFAGDLRFEKIEGSGFLIKKEMELAEEKCFVAIKKV